MIFLMESSIAYFMWKKFEKYMKRKFSNLYIKNVEDIDMTKFSEFTSENEKFCEYFSYDCGENPSAKISEIFE